MFEHVILARRVALQALYQLDVQGEDFLVQQLHEFVAEAHDQPSVRDAALLMTRSAWKVRGEADAWLEKLSTKWSVARMPIVDRNILRLAIWELLHQEQVPPKVVLDQAIELAKEFSTAESSLFINGVLDAALREHVAQTGRKID